MVLVFSILLNYFCCIYRQLRADQHRKKMAIILELQGIHNVYIPRCRTIWSKERNDSVWHLLKNSNAVEFKEAFRISRELFNEICDLLKNELMPQSNLLSNREPVPVDKQVAMCLYKLACCAEYRVIGNVFGVHKSTVHKYFYNVVEAINKVLLWNEIKMPDADECQHISSKFHQSSGLPQIVGCIDGSHIPILAPSEGRKDFVNRKQWPSIILQAVVDKFCM